MAKNVFTFEEVAKHINNGDCWLIINAKVYDVSLFLEEHPGGSGVLLNAAGKDATSDFEDVGHSSDAEGKMKELFIGNIDESTLPRIISRSQPTAASPITNNDSEGSLSKFLLYVLPLLILGVDFLLRYFSKNEGV